MKYSKEFKLECIKKYKAGLYVETPPGCKRKTFADKLRDWVCIYEELGEAGLDHHKPQLSLEEKLVLIDRIENGESISSVARTVGRQPTSISNWYKIYLEKGIDGLQSLKRGRSPSMSKKKQKKKNKPEIEDLREQVEYLKAENEYLKKLDALVQKRKGRQQKKK